MSRSFLSGISKGGMKRLQCRLFSCIIPSEPIFIKERIVIHMNKKELIEVVSSKAEITKVEAQKVVNVMFDAIIEGLAGDGKVVLPGFGSFEVRARTARVGRNPRTGDQIKIEASRVPAFKPGKDMKEAVAKK